MEHQQPKPYDAVLGGENQAPEGAAVLGGIEGVKLRLSNENPEVRIKALHQALNYGEAGLDLIIKALQDEFPKVQIQAYSLLIPLSEQKVKRALQGLESIEVVTVNRCGEIIQRRQYLARYFVEDLGNGIDLEMAYIPGGTFMMGSPNTEKGRHSSEQPQHEVTVQPFYMGKFSVTQAQWQTVAKLPKRKRKLKVDASCFKGENRPVEQISWYDAIEFCARLSKATGKKYRLPSEAEWEYACRAGTTTPFHYGETITSKLANYEAIKTYSSEVLGNYRQQTIPVGQFPPNAFGLYDMHGNVWEWCQDNWHWNYKGAPTDNRPWIDNKSVNRVLRCGSWRSDPSYCRSALRRKEYWLVANRDYGFRVVCDIF
ncbi:MAG: SUMF1/EgtB/PvdO family nonheme iron enzyme [Cyanobacteria bacterium P01_C01_bin.38]